MTYKTLILALIGLFSYANAVSKCPGALVPIGSPCYFQDTPNSCNIGCRGDKPFDIKTIFAELDQKLPTDQKQFKDFYLNNTAIVELPANAFAGIQFTTIYIERAGSLRRVNPLAFNGTAATVSNFWLRGSPVGADKGSDSDLFAAINTLTELTSLGVWETSVNVLPTMAISGHKHLAYIYLQSNPIKIIETNALNNLPMLQIIRINNARIARVDKQAFTVGHGIGGPQRVTISLVGDGLTGASFAPGAFDGIQCVTNIFMNINEVNYLDQDVFGSFLADSPQNTIVMGPDMQCKDSRNQWIHDKYPRVWKELNCGQN